jgi:hypothetical protein
MPNGNIFLIAPMKLTRNTWVSSKRTWRAFALALSFAFLTWVGFAHGFAQTNKSRRVVSMKLADGREGSRVTVVADINLNDYEAFRRGDRFFLKLPASEFASAQPNFRGNGFDDVQIQRTGESVLISFKLQPGATARIDQRFNRLDVVFTASKTNNSQNNTGASKQNVGNSSAQNRDRRTSDAAGPLPPNSPVNVSRNTTDRSDRSNHVPSAGSNPTDVAAQNSPSGETIPGKAAKPAASPASTIGSANSGTLLPSIQTVTGSSTQGGSQTPPGSSASPTPYEFVLPTLSSTPATVSATPYVAPNPAVNNERQSGSVLSQRWSTFKEWLRLNWDLLIGVVAALIILLVFGLFLRRRLQSGEARKLITSRSSRWKGEKVGPSYRPTVEQETVEQEQSDEPSIAEEVVRIDPAPVPIIEVDEPARPAATSDTTEEEVLELPPSAASVSELSEVKELAVEPPFSNTPAQFERADFEVKKLLSGREFDANLIDAPDTPTRQVIAASLMAALASATRTTRSCKKRFVDYGYFDETTKDLRTADSPAERAASARKLGLVGDSRATAHLIAALYDSAPEVRKASVESLGQIGDSSAIKPLNDLLQRETSRQLPEAVIRQAINSITVTEVKRTTGAEKPALRVVEKQPEAPVPHLSNAEFVAFIDEIKDEDLEPHGFVPTTSSFPIVPALGTQSFVSAEEETLQREEEALRLAAIDLERRRLEAEMARKKFEDEARLKKDRGAQARGEIEARVRAEEEARRRAEEEVLRHRIEEEVRIKAEQEARVKAEEEARIRAEEETRFRLEADTLRRAAEDLSRKRAEADSARKLIEAEARRRVEEDARQRAEDEARLAIESEARRKIEEEIRRKVELELQDRAHEQARRIAEEEAKRRVDEESRRLAEEANRQRVQEEARRSAEEAVAQRVADEARRMAEEQASRLAEHDMLRRSQAEGLFREAEERRRSEEERLQLEQQALIQAADDVARRRREIEEARRKAEEDARSLVETQERIRVEEEDRRRAAEERVRLETEARRRAEEERQRFEEARQRTFEEQKRREEDARKKTEEESRLLAAAQERIRVEEEARKQAQEQRLRLEAEVEARTAERRRLEEERLRAIDEHNHREEVARAKAAQEARLLAAAQERILAEEKAHKENEVQRQRLEAEAVTRAEERKRSAELLQRVEEEHKRIEDESRQVALEEERRLAELEAVRQRAEDQARRRFEVEQRIKAEIDALHKAEQEQRLRIEAETKRRAEAEVKLREEKARHQAEEEARLHAEREAHLAEEAHLKTEDESRRRAEEEFRQQAEREARRLAEEDARRREHDEVRQREERESRLRVEEEAHRNAEEDRIRATEAEARQREEQEQRRQTEEESQRHVQEAYRRQSEAARLLDEERAFGLESQGEVEKTSAPEMVWGEGALPESQPRAKAAEPTVSSQPMHVEDKGIEFVRAEKGIAQLGEDSDVSAELVNRLNSDEPEERVGALADLARLGGDDAFRFIGKAFDDQSVDVRNAAARALYDVQPDRAASFTRALREGTTERRRSIGASLASSGLAVDAIANLTGESREKTYDAFSLLFLMAKAGEVQPLMKAIEDYPNIEVRLAVVKLLALSGQPEIVPAFRRLAVRGSLPSEVRSAVMEAIYQISSQNRETAPSAA